jgi:transposase
MNKKQARQSQDWREIRRLRAWDLKQKGWKQKDIAEALGVSEGAVSQWIRKAKEGGEEALYKRTGGGPKPRLTPEQLAHLPELLKKGAEHFGFRGEVWTRARVAVIIKREFGVSYTPVHVGRLLKAIGWSSQKPIERASQRDEAAVEHWRTGAWPELQKKLHGKDER